MTEDITNDANQNSVPNAKADGETPAGILEEPTSAEVVESPLEQNTETEPPVIETPVNPPPQPAGASIATTPSTPNVSEKFSENMGRWKEHLTEALAGKEKKKQKNILIILKLAELHGGVIRNEQVQKALRCTQLTAYRYLSGLEKQGKLHRTGGHNVPTYKII